jgi:hypothetical protein
MRLQQGKKALQKLSNCLVTALLAIMRHKGHVSVLVMKTA